MADLTEQIQDLQHEVDGLDADAPEERLALSTAIASLRVQFAKLQQEILKLRCSNYQAQ